MKNFLTFLDIYFYSDGKYPTSSLNSDLNSSNHDKFLYKMQLKCNNMTENTIEDLPVSFAHFLLSATYVWRNLNHVLKCNVLLLFI